MATFEDILEKLKQGIGGVMNSPATAQDAMTAASPRPEARGIGGVLGVLQHGLSSRRMRDKVFSEANEDRLLNNDLKKAQAENLRSLGTYREGQLENKSRYNDILATREMARQETDKAKLEILQKRMTLQKEELEVKIKNAETYAAGIANTAERAKVQQEIDRMKLEHAIADDTEKNLIARINANANASQAATAAGNLAVREKESPSVIEGNQARAGLAGAQTEQTQAETGILNSPLMQSSRLFKALMDGVKSGAIKDESGVKAFFESNYGPAVTGVSSPEPAGVVGSVIPALKPKQQAISRPTTPSAPARPAAAAPKKQATMAIVQEYLKKAGGDKAKAAKMLDAAGYTGY